MIPAIEFLKDHGSTSLISLGCGPELNRIDNHIKLLRGCGLKHYVGIDRVPSIRFDHRTVFSDGSSAVSLYSEQYGGAPESFDQTVRVFPDTLVEELRGIHCRVVVCQRVLPFKHWEDVIISMNPVLVLQEDLNGCELQDMSGPHYTRTRSGIRHFGLQPFRSLPFLPWERNLILWRRKDFYTCDAERHSWWRRLWMRL
jgi:hypothetical protein